MAQYSTRQCISICKYSGKYWVAFRYSNVSWSKTTVTIFFSRILGCYDGRDEHSDEKEDGSYSDDDQDLGADDGEPADVDQDWEANNSKGDVQRESRRHLPPSSSSPSLLRC